MTDEATGGWFSGDPDTGTTGPRLFCFPHGGGGAGAFRRWKAELAPSIEVVPVHLPGRESRFAEPLLTSVAAVVTALVGPLSARVRGPFALFGHSMGALLAYETAAALTDRGLPPAHLFASGHHPPHLPPATPAMHGLPDAELVARLAEFGGTPPELLGDPALMELLLPRLRADFEICETYRYAARPPLPVPITVFAGRDDPSVDVGELGRWGDLTTEGAEVHILDGGHFGFAGPDGNGVLPMVAHAWRGISRR
ncbi:thioesterase II family protein [Symbioplanes lichenis]|uniref:thioesterase II family protein n=1 Tax=Symbioplanes lichenis TaxID=1629072 RepID=UPI002739D1A6|nr:alpha/beta fold hydrolase [Actinoplanes lichenis]